ncbi:MAG: fucose isomerase [Armatimonadota bacterium]|nr:fucose isomerase [Armatimonadota bacterium]
MKVGVLTFTDGRKRCADLLDQDCRRFQSEVDSWLTTEGHEAVEFSQIVWNYRTAIDGAERMNEKKCDAVIFNFCVWAFPDFAAQAAMCVEAPILFLGNVNPRFPGWVAFFAAAGALDEIGRPFGRALGDLGDAFVGDSVRQWLHKNGDKRQIGISAAETLRGLRYGEFDGPSMGMYTGHIDPSQWMEQFGIHVHHRSQLTLAFLCDAVADDRVEHGVNWLEKKCKEIRWGDLLTREHLSRQVRLYYATKDFCRDEGIDFLGLTGQLDFTEWKDGIIMDVPEAFFNDTADPEDENKRPKICATECDSNGALTMRILNEIADTPVLFADLRHYFADQNVYDLVNSGQHAPWFSRRSANPAENWGEVTLHPANPMYFPCGGASVEFFAAPCDVVTYARLTRKSGVYRMHYFTGSFVRFDEEMDHSLAEQTSPEWPHAFARFSCSRDSLTRVFEQSHSRCSGGRDCRVGGMLRGTRSGRDRYR